MDQEQDQVFEYKHKTTVIHQGI